MSSAGDKRSASAPVVNEPSAQRPRTADVAHPQPQNLLSLMRSSNEALLRGLNVCLKALLTCEVGSSLYFKGNSYNYPSFAEVEKPWGTCFLVVDIMSSKESTTKELEQIISISRSAAASLENALKKETIFPNAPTVYSALLFWRSMSWKTIFEHLKLNAMDLTIVFAIKETKKMITLSYGNAGVFLDGIRLPTNGPFSSHTAVYADAGIKLPCYSEGRHTSILGTQKYPDRMANVVSRTVGVDERSFTDTSKLVILPSCVVSWIDENFSTPMMPTSLFLANLITTLSSLPIGEFRKKLAEELIHQILVINSCFITDRNKARYIPAVGVLANEIGSPVRQLTPVANPPGGEMRQTTPVVNPPSGEMKQPVRELPKAPTKTGPAKPKVD